MAQDFSPISVYDTPMVLASMLVDGEFTARGGMNALVNPNTLSPAERDTIAERLKKQAGGSGLTGAAIDIALNPWVWAFFATSNPGMKALSESGRGVFSVSKKYMTSVAEQSSWLKSLGGWTGWQMLRDRALPHALLQVSREISKKVAEGAAFEAPLAKWMADNGLETMNLADIKDPMKREKVEKALTYLYVSLTGRDQTRKVKIASGIEKDLSGVSFKETELPAWTTREAVEKGLGEMGLVEARDSLRAFYKQRFTELFGDEDRILRIYRGLRNPSIRGSKEAGTHGMGEQLVSQILGDDMAEKVRDGEVSLDTFRKIVRETIHGPKDDFYLPRNVWDMNPLVGERIGTKRVVARAMGASSSSIAREKGTVVHSPDSLQMVKKHLPTTEAWDKEYKVATAQWADGIKDNRPIRFVRIDPVEMTRRYNNDTSRTYAWHVQDPDEVVRATMKREYDRAKPSVWYTDPSLSKAYDKDADSLATAITDSTKAPRGGFSLADVVHSGWSVTKDPYTREAIEKVLIPAMSGQYGVRHLAMAAAANNSKRMIRSLVDGGIGKSISKSGPHGERFIDKLREASEVNADITAGGGTLSSRLANYLYVTHLGLSLPSIFLNATQPMTLAASWVGPGNVLKAYGTAFKELAGYTNERLSKYGVAPISNAQRSELAAKHFRYADEAGIGPHIMEQLDSKMFVTGTPYRKESIFDQVTHYLMGGFQMSEWLNRSVTSHALENVYRASNRADEIGSSLFRSEVRQFVDETQFASHPLNTPMFFLTDETGLSATGRVFANPLMRMFLSFPYRTLNAVTSVGPKLGEREGVWPLVNDVARGMGISAILFEAGKNLMGADLSRAGYFASATDLIPGMRGGRFDFRDGPFPTPPVIDIPFQVMKALATDDRELLARNLARTVPGGIALSRAMNVMPELPPPASFIQRQYADWGVRTEDGKVPIFDQTGRLLDAQDPVAMIAKGIGADLGAFKDEQDLNAYFLKQGQEMSGYKRAFVQAHISGDRNKADKIRAEYQKRFKMPLRISRQQIRAAIEMRTQPRAERVMERLPREARPYYAAMLAPSAPLPLDQAGEQEPQRAFDPFKPY